MGRVNDLNQRSKQLFSRCMFYMEYAEGGDKRGEISLSSKTPFTLSEMEGFLAESSEKPLLYVVCYPRGGG